MPVLQVKGSPRRGPPEGGLHRGLRRQRRHRAPRPRPLHQDEVLARPRAGDLRPPPGVQAGPARLHKADSVPRVLGGPRCGRRLDQPGTHDRPGGPHASASAARSSATCGEELMSRVGQDPHPPAQRGRRDDRQGPRHGEGPQGHGSSRTSPRAITVRQDDGEEGRCWCSSVPTTSVRAAPCTAVPLAGGQHGPRRHRGLPQGTGDHRCGLPAPPRGLGRHRARPRLQPPGHGGGP